MIPFILFVLLDLFNFFDLLNHQQKDNNVVEIKVCSNCCDAQGAAERRNSIFLKNKLRQKQLLNLSSITIFKAFFHC